jgi:hypothetical protein
MTTKCRTLTARDGEQFATQLIKHNGVWVVRLESDTFAACLPLTPFLASLLAKKASKGCVA